MADRLTRRQREVLTWIARGKTAKDTGTILNISPRTVEWYIAQAVALLGTSNSVAAVAIAVAKGAIKISFITFGGVVANAVSDWAIIADLTLV